MTAALVLEATGKFSVVAIVRRGATTAVPPDKAARSCPAVTAAEGDSTLYARLTDLFRATGTPFEEMFHEPTLTSEASVMARVAGGWTETTLKSGAKAMLMRRSKAKPAEPQFVLCVLAADRKLDWKLLKKAVAKDLRLATEAEVFEVAKCLPGAVPPFGSHFFAQPPPPTFLDDSLDANTLDFVNFNCGLRSRSVRMPLPAYLALEKPTVVRISSS